MDVSKNISEYFYRARDIVKEFNENNRVVLQFFQRQDNTVLAGMKEVLELLREKISGTNTIVRYLEDGTLIHNKEPVLELEGKYQDFGIYEALIDGILARCTSIATNSHRCIKASRGKEIISMSDRSDHYINHSRDGEAMYIGGIRSFSSYAHVPIGKEKECVVYGSIPHALIQNFKGDLIKAMKHYHTLFPNEDLVALVDFHNDVIKDSLAVLKELRGILKGVRVDTSFSVKDKMFKENEEEYGVTPNQIKRLRKALDNEEYGKEVKIFVSSGFNPKKIEMFEEENTPVDGYGVGEYLLNIANTFSADAVVIDGELCAKEGRKYIENKRLKELVL